MGTDFEGLAIFYDQYRPGYPESLFDFLILRTSLLENDHVLDLGCGTGQLALPLAQRGFSVMGVDNDSAMIALLNSKCSEYKVSTLISRAEDFDFTSAEYKLVTMGRSFHWTDKKLILEKLYAALLKGSIVAIISDPIREGCKENEWLNIVYRIAVKRAGLELSEVEYSNDGFENDIIQSSFQTYERHCIPLTRSWSVDQIIGLHMSLSWCNKKVLGKLWNDFENEIRVALENTNPEGMFKELVDLEILILER